MTTRRTGKVMLLIDADNVTIDVIDQAVQRVVAEHGAAHVRRAYCTAELALKHLKLFKTHSIRPIVNISTGKNSTDIALAVDAMDLVMSERPETVVIVSSDSDFAPLVLRLREKGCRVEGIGQEGKTGEDSKPVYDAFVDLPHRRPHGETAAPAARKTVRTSRKSAGKKPISAPVPEAAAPVPIAASPAPPPARKSTRASTKSAGRTSRKTAAAVEASAASAPAPTPAPVPVPVPAPAPAPAPGLPEEVARILEALPELRDGARLQLNQAKERLCQAGLLAKSAPSTKLFRKHPGLFALTPDSAPNKVQFLGGR